METVEGAVAEATQGSPARLRRHVVLWASLALIVLIAAATGWDVYAGWRAHRQVVDRHMATLAEAAASQVEGSARAIALMLEDAAKSIDLDRWPNEEMAAQLRARISAFPEIRNFIVVDADGRMVGPNISTRAVPAKAVSLADREYFIYLRDHWRDNALYISSPVTSKLHGEPSLPLAWALKSKTGAFAGVVVVGVDPAYFEAKLEAMALEDGGAVALVRRDGIFLARFPNGDLVRGRSVVDSPLFREHLPQASAGVVRLPALPASAAATEPSHGLERLVAYRALANFPLVITVSVPMPVALKEWRARMAQGVVTVLVLAGTVLLLAFLLERREGARALLAHKLDTHRRDLERRVAERTGTLKGMLDERERTGALLEARLRLAQMLGGCTLHELLVATLDEICALTGAEVGFYHFLSPDQVTLSLQAWSTRTLREYCQASVGSGHYDVAAAGVWADCVRLGRSVVYNDYTALTTRKGLPEGHAQVRRLMSVPIFRDGRIAAIIGVGNKPSDFDQDDLVVVETLADLAWELAEHKQAEDALAERSELVLRRYEALRALGEIAALPPNCGNRQLADALALGAKHLGLPLGILARITDGDYAVVHHHAPADAGLADGQIFPLGDTYCAITLAAADVVAIPHMGKSPHAGHPCYKTFGLEAYIGVPVMVGKHRFGTINFSSPQPYPREFDDGDLEFMRLLARWVGSMLEREQAEAEVVAAKEAAEQRSQELANSNSDLEQFAYVASHDLRQPLRMVTSYLTLIERRYADKLDDNGREFIGYARDGAVQMDRLILDLLEYSRVGRHGQPSEPVDLADAAAEAARLLQVVVAESACTLNVATESAVITGNRTELVRLFQNLIGNGIKYRDAARVPVVEVGWRRDGADWLVSVTDNGIGIADEYRDDVFKIFRRLHASNEYEGTGIGLAICQKVVKKHGGRIWLNSQCGIGTTFFLTLPAAL